MTKVTRYIYEVIPSKHKKAGVALLFIVREGILSSNKAIGTSTSNKVFTTSLLSWIKYGILTTLYPKDS